jgi:hypothetical protein
MRRALIAAGSLALVYLLLREVAWRSDFMAALAGVQRGRPLQALAEVLFFGLRVVLVVAGPSLLAVLAARWLHRRLTQS